MPARKIGFVFDDSLDKPDGVQQYILTLGAWLSAQGHEVHYLTGQTTRTDIPNLHSLSRNIAVRFNGNSMAIPLPTSRRKLRQLLEREQFDVLHIQAPFSPWMGARLLRLASPRTVCVATFHILPQSQLVTLASRALALWTRGAWRRLDHVFSVSAVAQDFAQHVFGQTSTVLPNVIEYDRFHEVVPFKRQDNRLQLLYLGRLVPRKGCQDLLTALTLLSPEVRRGVSLTVCGRGALRQSLEAYVHRHGLEDTVAFAGFVSEADKPRFYAGADIAVFPSTGGESFGIVLLEAMASGRTAVLAANNPGYASVVSRPDALFIPGNPPDLARLLGTYIADPTHRRVVAAWGKTHAKSYDTSVVGKALVAEYERLCARKNLP